MVTSSIIPASDEREMALDYMNRFGVTEVDYRITENTPSDANAFHSIRKRFENYGNGDSLSMKRVNGGRPVPAPSVPTGNLNHVDILWVSDTEFVSVKLFDELDFEDIYQLTVALKGGGEPLELFCYSIFQFDEAGEVTIGPPPVTPPRFLSHVLAPILDQVASIELYSDGDTPPIQVQDCLRDLEERRRARGNARK
jgi:hypothetical protein